MEKSAREVYDINVSRVWDAGFLSAEYLQTLVSYYIIMYERNPFHVSDKF